MCLVLHVILLNRVSTRTDDILYSGREVLPPILMNKGTKGAREFLSQDFAALNLYKLLGGK